MKTINLQGKAYATFPSVLDQAHKEGLKLIESELIQTGNKENGNKYIYKATVQTEKGTFSAHGDAAPDSVGRMILPHINRMAETRAMGRALRMATNAQTLAEETELEHNVAANSPKAKKAASNGSPDEYPPAKLKKLDAKTLAAMIDWIGKGGSDDVKDKLPAYVRTKAQDSKLSKAFTDYSKTKGK